MFLWTKGVDAPSARTSDSSTCPDAPRGRLIVVTGAIRSRPIRVMIQFTNIMSEPSRIEASAHARQSSYLDARKQIYLFPLSSFMIPFFMFFFFIAFLFFNLFSLLYLAYSLIIVSLSTCLFRFVMS